MRSERHRCNRFLALAVPLFLAGCGQQDPFERVVVTGTVLFDGKPVEYGTIQFMPTAGTKTPPNGGYIINGEYRVKARGGVPVGTHRVKILGYEATRGSAVVEDDPQAAASGRQFIPAKYNTSTELVLQVDSNQSEIVKDWNLSQR